jgi:hypothetical protein
MYFKRVRQNKVPIKVFPQMKPRVGIPYGRKVEVDYVHGYNVRQFLVVLPLFQAFRVFLAPVKKTPSIHVVLVSDLHLDIDPGFALQDCPHVENAGLVAYDFRRQVFVFDDFHGGKAVFPGFSQDSVKEAQKLDFVAFFAHYFVEKEIIEMVVTFSSFHFCLHMY